MVAATLVGLMSLPGIAVLYGGLVQKKWAVNTMLMAFTGFSLVLVVWVLWGFKMGFGEPLKLGPGSCRPPWASHDRSWHRESAARRSSPCSTD